MATALKAGQARIEARRHPRIRVAVPFACAFSRLGLQRWLARDREGLGVVLDLSMSGARVMSPVSIAPGDQLTVCLRLPDQAATMNLDATVRWWKEHAFGLEFLSVSHLAESRLKKYLSRI